MGSDGWDARWAAAMAAVAVPDGAEVSVGVLDPVSGRASATAAGRS
ncbi:hypothetical protein [Streptomyces prasinus]